MKKFVLFFIAFGLIADLSFAQITPQNSPYNLYGPYTVVADSDATITPMVLSYRPSVTSGSPYPVFIFQLGANGFTSTAINDHTYDIYLKHLASWGYVVLVVNDTQAGIPNGTSFTTVHNWFKTKSANSGHWLNQYADTSKVVIGGHSNGGVNATALLLNRPNEIKGIVYFASYPSSFFPVQDVSQYTGKVLDMAGDQDNSSSPSACKTGYNSYTNASCKIWVLVGGMGHGGFGDYVNSSQPVGPIGRDSATATVRHFLVSFMESEFKNDAGANSQLNLPANQPNTITEFINSCFSAGITNYQRDKQLSVYPNPASTEISIKNPNLAEEATISVYATDGSIVLKQMVQGPEEILMQLDKFPSGIYMIRLTSGTKSLTTRFVKN